MGKNLCLIERKGEKQFKSERNWKEYERKQYKSERNQKENKQRP